MVALRRFAASSKRSDRPSTAAVARMRASRTAISSGESPLSAVASPGGGPRYSETSFRRSSDFSKDSGSASSSSGTECSEGLFLVELFGPICLRLDPRTPVETA